MNINKVGIFPCENRDIFNHYAVAHTVDELKASKWNEDVAVKHTISFLNPDTLLFEIGEVDDKKNKVFGWIELIELQEVLYLNFIYVKEEYRGKGIAEKALGMVIANNSKPRMQSTVRIVNEASMKLHKKLGFKTVASLLELDNSPSEVE